MKKISFLLFIFFAIILTNGFSQNPPTGYLTVNSDPLGIIIYLEGDSIGITPIENYRITAGVYSVSIFPSDTIESKYWQLANSPLKSKFNRFAELAKVGAGTKQVEILPDQKTEIFFSLSRINKAPQKTKITLSCCITGSFSLAFLLGYLLATFIR